MLFTGELLKQAERFTVEGLHPRLICEGYEIAKDMVLEFLDAFGVRKPSTPPPLRDKLKKKKTWGNLTRHCHPRADIFHDRETLTNVVKTALRTKLALELADKISNSIVDSVLSIAEENVPIDLHMVSSQPVA